MRKARRRFCFALVAALCAPGAEKELTLDEVRAEPNLEKRSQKALEFAEQSLERARKLASGGGGMKDLEAALAGVTGGVELALKSLRDTGKKASKLSRQYKRGELKSREIMRMLENLALALGYDSRRPAEEARDKVRGLHEEFLLAVMSGK